MEKGISGLTIVIGKRKIKEVSPPDTTSKRLQAKKEKQVEEEEKEKKESKGLIWKSIGRRFG
jgi:hypothetical protein